MITYQNASRRPGAFNRMFGFSVMAFNAIYTEFEPPISNAWHSLW